MTDWCWGGINTPEPLSPGGAALRYDSVSKVPTSDSTTVTFCRILLHITALLGLPCSLVLLPHSVTGVPWIYFFFSFLSFFNMVYLSTEGFF